MTAIRGKQVTGEKAVFLSDVHIPYHDNAAIKPLFDFMLDFQPDVIFLNGDIVDMYALSKYDKDPRRALELQAELDELWAFLSTLRAGFPKAEIYYIEGNHEHRLLKWLYANPEISGLGVLQPEEFFHCRAFDIEWVSQDTTFRYHDIIVTHGDVVRKGAGMSAKGQWEKYICNGVSGHTHRVGKYRKTFMGGSHMWVEQGCLCELNPTYIVGVADWQQGFAFGIYDGSKVWLQQVEIIDHQFFYDGRLYGGKSA
jgi:predicted phosphodiesterase